MGVGDYVHSKETRHYHPHKNDAPDKARQALAEQARIEVPASTLPAPIPVSANRQAQVDRYGAPFLEQSHEPAAKHMLRDMFDTDVEGIDDSTIAATSINGGDEIPYRFSPAPTTGVPVQAQSHEATALQAPPPPPPAEASPPRQPYQFRSVRRLHDSKWYQGLGDRALKAANLDADEADDASQLTSTAGDDEQSSNTDDQRFAPKYHNNQASEEPLSKRLQSFWSASRRSYSKPAPTTTQTEPTKFPTTTSKPKALPVNNSSARKVTLPRSMTTTPRTRFSPPKPSLLDQLDLTPTRRSSGTRPLGSGDGNGDVESHDQLQDSNVDGLGLFSSLNDNRARSASFQSLSAFDITNLDDLDDPHNDTNDPINDPFARRNSVRRIIPDTPSIKNNKKRQLELDHPPEVLYTKSFAELQAEPFDYTPAPTPTPPAPPSKSPANEQNTKPPEKASDEDKISFLLRLSEQERREYFARLSMDEWEDYGDLLLDQFSKLLSKMKELRKSRRKTAAVFEKEIRRRHGLVEEQSAELSAKFEEMRAGGAEVLRGRTP